MTENRKNGNKRYRHMTAALLLALMLLLAGCGRAGMEDAASSALLQESAVQEGNDATDDTDVSPEGQEEESGDQKRELSSLFSEIPEYDGSAYVILNDNVPDFSEDDLTEESYESYSGLDELGRCGAAVACIGQDLMPEDERGDISDVYPSGWVQAEYDFVDGGYLYNRCHLIGYQLTAENGNEGNLITGTRYMNVEGMLPFENMVADYVRESGNHVLYRVTPVFEGDTLVASGVVIEALSVEDGGEGISFHVYCYNVQPGVEIDYATGESREADDDTDSLASSAEMDTEETETFVLNTNTMKFHDPGCQSAEDIAEWNREEYTGSRQDLTEAGYEPCGRCDP